MGLCDQHRRGAVLKRQAVVLSAALAAVLLLGVAVVSSGVAEQPGPPAGTLDLVQLNRESSFKFIDNPPRGGEDQEPSPGDMAIIGATLRDTSNRRAGRLHVVFTRLEGRRKYVDSVDATFRVEGGYIVVGGISHGGRTDDAAITGGTGRYAGARGTLRITETRQGARFRFTFMGSLFICSPAQLSRIAPVS